MRHSGLRDDAELKDCEILVVRTKEVAPSVGVRSLGSTALLAIKHRVLYLVTALCDAKGKLATFQSRRLWVGLVSLSDLRQDAECRVIRC
jgi:hypothetical protein